MRGGLSADAFAGADSVRARAFAHLDARLLRHAAAPVALALSGGGDSLALLRLASAWCATAGRPLLALTVDHRLSPDAARWTAFAAERARAAGSSWRALPWLGDKPSTGLAAAARDARHALLAEAARAAGACVVLMGHTADDVIEGERMRLSDAPTLGRLRAWAPSPVWPAGRGVALLRPLLEVGRGELRTWLRAHGEGVWVDDPANEDLGSARARARAYSGDGAARSAERTLEPPFEAVALSLSVRAGAGGELAWPYAALRDVDAPVGARVLAAAAVCAGGGPRSLGGSPAARLLGAALRGEVRTLAGARLHTHGGEMVLARAPPRGRPPVTPLVNGQVWDGRFEVSGLDARWRVAPLAGRAARLPPAERRALAGFDAAVRPMLPALIDEGGAPRLPRPFGEGPAFVRSLAAPRLRLTLGGLRTEADLVDDARRSECPADEDHRLLPDARGTYSAPSPCR